MWKIALCTIIITGLYWILIKIAGVFFGKFMRAHDTVFDAIIIIGLIGAVLSVIAVFYLAIHVIVIL